MRGRLIVREQPPAGGVAPAGPQPPATARPGGTAIRPATTAARPGGTAVRPATAARRPAAPTADQELARTGLGAAALAAAGTSAMTAGTAALQAARRRGNARTDSTDAAGVPTADADDVDT